MIGLGGSWRFSENTTLEIAVTEDDGTFHAAPDTGLHARTLLEIVEAGPKPKS